MVRNLVDLGLVARNYYDGPLMVVRQREVRWLYRRRRCSIPPAISLYAPSKPTPVARREVDELRARWRRVMRRADQVIVIGARPLRADQHIWAPIEYAEADVWFIGGTGGAHWDTFERRLGSRLRHLGDRFGDALEDLLGRLAKRPR